MKNLFFPSLGMLSVVALVYGFLASALVSSASTWKVLIGLVLVVAFPVGAALAAWLLSKENKR